LTTAAPESDGELVARALVGEDVAFEKLIGRHKRWAHRFIRRYVGNAEDAYDLLQDTFFSAWLALASYQQDRPFDFWLRRIALNKCRDRARREKVRQVLRYVTIHGEAQELPESRAGPEVQVAAEQGLEQLERAIARLPRGLKEPLLLTTLEGLSHQQAGELLGLNAKAVEMRIYRARTQLNALLGKGSDL
jgi:RNA polymerase sigma factor (sigma-70 family)